MGKNEKELRLLRFLVDEFFDGDAVSFTIDGKRFVSVDWLEKKLKSKVDGCVYGLKHKNTDKGLNLSYEDTIRVNQSLFLYKEWLKMIRLKSQVGEK